MADQPRLPKPVPSSRKSTLKNSDAPETGIDDIKQEKPTDVAHIDVKMEEIHPSSSTRRQSQQQDVVPISAYTRPPPPGPVFCCVFKNNYYLKSHIVNDP